MPRPTSAIEAYLGHLQANRRYSPHTLDGYRRDLARLVVLAGEQALEGLTTTHIRQFIAELHGDGLGARSLARMLASWRGFYRWWMRADAPPAGEMSDQAGSHPAKPLMSNPVDGVRAPKAARGLPKALSVEHTQVLMERPVAQVASEPLALRDQAMFELLYSSGLRLSELVLLDSGYVRAGAYESAGWIDLSEREVTVRGKGGKQRVVPIGAPAAAALTAWLAVRASLARTEGAPSDIHALFVGARGARISPRVVQLQLKQAAIQAGLPTHVHPHVLRHSFASHVLQSAQDLRAVQEMLGHANITTTQIYTRLDFQHLARAYDQAHPRSGRKT